MTKPKFRFEKPIIKSKIEPASKNVLWYFSKLKKGLTINTIKEYVKALGWVDLFDTDPTEILVASNNSIFNTPPPNNEIWYITSNGQKTNFGFGALLHTYSDKGILTYSRDVVSAFEEFLGDIYSLIMVSLPKSVEYVGSSYIYDCIVIIHNDEVVVKPSLDFASVKSLFVPVSMVDAYKESVYWKDNADVIQPIYIPNDFKLDVLSKNEAFGSVEINYHIKGGSKITAIPSSNYKFVMWSDFNTENPRKLVVTEDTSLSAVFVLGDRFD